MGPRAGFFLSLANLDEVGQVRGPHDAFIAAMKTEVDLDFMFHKDPDEKE